LSSSLKIRKSWQRNLGLIALTPMGTDTLYEVVKVIGMGLAFHFSNVVNFLPGAGKMGNRLEDLEKLCGTCKEHLTESELKWLKLPEP